ncbi:MAG: HEAT repeat domain-containing protein [bacterium]|jgi:hypothetical protein
MPDTVTVDVDALIDKQVRDIVGLFSKAAKNYQVYLPNNRMFLSSLTEFAGALQKFLYDHETLSLIVSEFDLYYGGKAVYENPDKHQSLAFRMYRDGVRLLSFHKGVSTKELLDLLEALSQCMEIDNLEEDFVTLLWEKDLKRITYYEIEDYEEELEVQRPREESAAGVQDDVFGPDAEAMPPEQLQDIEEMKNMLQFTNDELDQAKAMVESGDDDLLILRAWHVIQSTIDIKKSPDAFMDLSNAVGHLIDMAVQRGRIGDAATVIKEAKAVYGKSESPEIKAALGRIVDAGHADRNIMQIAEIISTNLGMQADDILRYLSELSPRAIKPILGLISVCKHKMSRQVIAGALASIAADDPPLILQNSNNDAPLETEMCLDVLEAIGSEQAMREVLRLKNHASPKVRARVVSLAAKMGDSHAVDIAKSLIDDEDPLVRRRALVTITDIEGEKCEDFLTEVFTSKQFAMLSHDQKKGMLLVIRRLPDEVQDRVANTILAMGGIFQRKSTQDTKKALTEVLNMKSEPQDSERPWRRREERGSE